jgi:hypothetical protein
MPGPGGQLPPDGVVSLAGMRILISEVVRMPSLGRDA